MRLISPTGLASSKVSVLGSRTCRAGTCKWPGVCKTCSILHCCAWNSSSKDDVYTVELHQKVTAPVSSRPEVLCMTTWMSYTGAGGAAMQAWPHDLMLCLLLRSCVASFLVYGTAWRSMSSLVSGPTHGICKSCSVMLITSGRRKLNLRM